METVLGGLSSWGEAAGPAWRHSSLSGNQARLCPSVMRSSTPRACLEGSSFALGRGLRGGWSGQNELGAAGSEQNPVSACPAGGTRRTSGGCVPGLVSHHQPRGLSPAGPGSGVEAEEWHPNKTGPTGWTDPQGLLATASPPNLSFSPSRYLPPLEIHQPSFGSCFSRTSSLNVDELFSKDHFISQLAMGFAEHHFWCMLINATKRREFHLSYESGKHLILDAFLRDLTKHC